MTILTQLVARGLLARLVSTDFLFVMLVIGFAFTFIQGIRKRLTYRMRLVSSAISVTIAVYLITMGVMYILSRMTIFILLGLLSFLLAYRLIRTDIRTWRWFRERTYTSE